MTTRAPAVLKKAHFSAILCIFDFHFELSLHSNLLKKVCELLAESKRYRNKCIAMSLITQFGGALGPWVTRKLSLCCTALTSSHPLTTELLSRNTIIFHPQMRDN